jgi:translation elongation factor EF-Tu-like GTPase
MLLALTIFWYATPKTAQAQEPIKKDGVDVTIPDGTELIVLLDDEISSASATEGDPVNFKVKDDIKVDGKTVIARDTLVKGTIANAQKAGRMGKGGKLGIRVESTTTVDGQKLRLRASKGGEGGDKVGTVIALSVFFGLFGLLKKGKNAKIKKGTEIKTYTDEAKVVRVTAV